MVLDSALPVNHPTWPQQSAGLDWWCFSSHLKGLFSFNWLARSPRHLTSVEYILRRVEVTCGLSLTHLAIMCVVRLIWVRDAILLFFRYSSKVRNDSVHQEEQPGQSWGETLPSKRGISKRRPTNYPLLAIHCWSVWKNSRGYLAKHCILSSFTLRIKHPDISMTI